MGKITIIVGMVLILLSPVLGLSYSSSLLFFLGGMETDMYYILTEGCISSIRALGIVVFAWGTVRELRRRE